MLQLPRPLGCRPLWPFSGSVVPYLPFCAVSLVTSSLCQGCHRRQSSAPSPLHHEREEEVAVVPPGVMLEREKALAVF